MKFFSKLIIGFICGIALSHFGWAATGLESKNELRNKMISILQERFPGAAIEIISGSSTSGPCEGRCSVKNVSLVRENGTGVAEFRYQLAGQESVIETEQVTFSAKVPTWIAKKRIRPGEKLNTSDFDSVEVDVSKGIAHQYRGQMLKSDIDLNSLQARLTVLEGQYPLSNGVEKVPTIRKGDVVQVKVTSGDIQLMTQAIAQEAGYEDQKLRVITQKNKRELTGLLKEGGVVEVKL